MLDIIMQLDISADIIKTDSQTKLYSNKSNQPKLAIKGLQEIDDIVGKTWLDKTSMNSKIKMTQTQWISPIKNSKKDLK